MNRFIKRGGERGETMTFTAIAWVCTLPLIALIAIPFLGLAKAGTLALVWLAGLALGCFLICLRRLPRHWAGKPRS